MPPKKPKPKRQSALKGENQPATSTGGERKATGEPTPALVPRTAIPLEALVPPEPLEPPSDFTPADATDPSPLPPIAVKIEAAAKRLYRAATTALPDPPADDADESEQRAFLQAVEDWKSDLCFTAGWGGADLDRHIPAEYREVEPPDENGVATTTFKRPLSAHEFVAFDLYREVLAELSNRTTCILGHTRWPTRGTPAEPLNNQPIRRGRTLGTQYVQSDVMGGWGG